MTTDRDTLTAGAGFRYEPTPEEVKAARLLHDKGWTVSEPRCPECSGYGHTWTAIRAGPFDDVADMKIKPCSRGCPPPAMYYRAAVPA